MRDIDYLVIAPVREADILCSQWIFSFEVDVLEVKKWDMEQLVKNQRVYKPTPNKRGQRTYNPCSGERGTHCVVWSQERATVAQIAKNCIGCYHQEVSNHSGNNTVSNVLRGNLESWHSFMWIYIDTYHLPKHWQRALRHILTHAVDVG